MTDHITVQRSENSAPQDSVAAATLYNASAEASDEIELRPLLQAVRAGWRLPVLLGGIAALLALLLVLFSQPIFEASGSLYLGSAEKSHSVSSGALGGFSLLSGLLQGSSMATQVDIVRSRDFVEQAILVSGLNTQVWPAGSSARVPFWKWLLEGRSLSVYAAPANGLQTTLADVTDPNIANIADKTLDIHFLAGGYYQIIKGKRILLRGKLGQTAVGPGIRLVLRAVQPGYVPPIHALYHLRVQKPRATYDAITKAGTLNVVQLGGGSGAGANATYIVHVLYQNTDPFAAQRFVQTLMQTYLDKTHAWATGQAGATYDYLSAQMRKIRSALSAANSSLANYQAHSGVIAVSAGAQAMIKQEADYEKQKSALKLQMFTLQQLRQQLSSPNASIDPFILNSIDNPVLNQLSGRLAAAQTKRISMEKLYTPAAPQVVQITAEINSIQSAIRNLIDNQTKTAQQQLQSLDGMLGQYQEKMGKFPQAELKVISLTRSSEVLGKLYMFLLQKQEEAAIQKASTITKNRILNSAVVHNQQIYPKPKETIFIYGLFAMFVGFSLVLGRFLLLPVFRSDEEIQRTYHFLPIYGLLPTYKSDLIGKEKTFQMPDARSGYGEALRLLRSNLYLASGQKSGQVLLISSASSSDGKSTLSYYLASVMAQDGKKILVIDFDLRKPHLHEVFSLSQSPGMIDILSQQKTWQESLQHIQNPPMDLITAGYIPPNPSEYLISDVLAKILTDMRSAYDYIFLDTPPFPMVGDALLLGSHADRILIVARVHATLRKAFRELVQGIFGLGKPLGLIINGVQVNASYGYGYGYHYGQSATATKGSWPIRLSKWMQRLWG